MSSKVFEIITFRKEYTKTGDYWYRCRVAVDGRVAPEFTVPASDVEAFPTEFDLHSFLERQGRGLVESFGDARSSAAA